jgi:hypothetical protein
LEKKKKKKNKKEKKEKKEKRIMMNFRFLTATKPLFCSSYLHVQITSHVDWRIFSDGGIIGVLEG